MIKIFFSLLFISVLSQAQHTKIIAHRGAWKNLDLPQNSIASLKNALKIGCYGSEFDVRLTLDSVLVINHDSEFMGMEIEKTSLANLRNRVGDKDNK